MRTQRAWVFVENLADDSTKISRESAYPSKSRMEQKSISYRFGSIFLSQIESLKQYLYLQKAA